MIVSSDIIFCTPFWFVIDVSVIIICIDSCLISFVTATSDKDLIVPGFSFLACCFVVMSFFLSTLDVIFSFFPVVLSVFKDRVILSFVLFFLELSTPSPVSILFVLSDLGIIKSARISFLGSVYLQEDEDKNEIKVKKIGERMLCFMGVIAFMDGIL